MFQDLNVLKTAMQMARHAGTQQAVSAENIANADTPGFKAARVTPFTDLVNRAEGGFDQRATRPGHMNGTTDIGAPEIARLRGSEDPNGNGVVLEMEMLTAVDAKRQHDRALAIYRSGISVLRASLGRN